MKVKYIRKGEYQGNMMTIGKVYEVLAIEYDCYRILNDNQEPCLYDSDQFEITDDSEPDFWVEHTETDEDGNIEKSFGPLAWQNNYFFEDYHDKDKKIVQQFWVDCETLYGIKKRA